MLSSCSAFHFNIKCTKMASSEFTKLECAVQQDAAV
jgi:hypothetical protein